jgi:restriction system protein
MKYIDGKKLTLDKFLQVLLSKYNSILLPNNHFPTDEMLNEFLQTVKEERSDTEVKEILRAFFIKNCTFNIDILYKDSYKKMDWINSDDLKDHYNRFSQTQYFKRLMAHEKDTDTVQEGNTWVIDLLPHFPNEALRGLDAYFLANCQFLSDSYLTAFGDWTSIIRAKYIDAEVPQDIFMNLQPKEFELIVAELYQEMGYETKLTKSSYDGGVDIIAEKKKTGKKEILFIQCKRYSNNVGIRPVRELLGVISDSKATKAAMITCSNFSREAKKFASSNPRIELINMKELTKLLNLHLGILWTVKAEKYFMKQKQKLK